MKAAQLVKYADEGGIEIRDVPKPVGRPGHVLIEVHAAGVNAMDWKIRKGLAQKWLPLQLPATLGFDFSGVVAEVGEGVMGYAAGDEVFGQANIHTAGAFAEYTLAEAKSLAKKPKSLSHVEAAALPLTGASAWQALAEHIDLRKGQQILIHGGAGGIGTYAVQFAKYLGAYVAATAGTGDLDYVRKLGADEVIDYKAQKFEEIIHDYDAVFDTVGGETYERSYQVLQKGGILVSMAAQPVPEKEKQYGVKALAQQTQTNTEHLAKVAELTEKGALKIYVDKIFPLSETSQALTYMEKSHSRGKIVLRIRDS